MLARTTSMPVSVRDLVALTKPRLSALVLITCGGGMFLAPGRIDALRALVGLLGTAMVVGAANALNCYIERDLDRYMDRTRTRPLPDARMEPWIALVLAAALASIAIPTITLAVNALTGLLAAIALLTYVVIYTPLKQRSSLALWVGAIPGAMPPLMGWTAVRGRIELPGLVLFAILFFWQLPHFIAIALFRSEDYARAGHKVLPLVIGERASRIHALVWTLCLVPVTLLPTPLGVAGNVYFVVASVLGAVFLWVAARGVFGAQAEGWPKKLFHTSLTYLAVLFAALALNAR